MDIKYLDSDGYRETVVEESGTSIICREIGATAEPLEDIPVGYNHVKLFVIDGKMQVAINGECYTLQRGDFADVVKCPMKLTGSSDDARAYMLMLTDNHIQELLANHLPFFFQYVLCKLVDPIYHIGRSDFNTVLRNMENIHMATISRNNRFAEDILKYKVLIFFLEIANILDNGGETRDKNISESEKQKMLFNRFIKQLETHIHREHTVNFYAASLNVTPQYLRRTVKEISGQNAYKLISDFLLREICNLLKDTDYTLQEIAEELHFSDQSVLSKFFKRNKGISPLKYRNDHC